MLANSLRALVTVRAMTPKRRFLAKAAHFEARKKNGRRHAQSARTEGKDREALSANLFPVMPREELLFFFILVSEIL